MTRDGNGRFTAKELAHAALMTAECVLLAVDAPRKQHITVTDVVTGFMQPRGTKHQPKLSFVPRAQERLETRIKTLVRLPLDRKSRKAVIVIDRRTNRIDMRQTDGVLVGCEHTDLLAIRQYIAMGRATELLRPVTRRIERAYRAKEKEAGMSRHAIALLAQLEPQLDTETATLLRDALKNTWRTERKLRQKVTFPLARHALSQARLRIEFISEEDAAEYGGEPSRYLTWTDAEGDVIASGHFSTTEDVYVEVYGSRFIRTEADQLSVCHDDIEEVDRGAQLLSEAPQQKRTIVPSLSMNRLSDVRFTKPEVRIDSNGHSSSD